MSEVRAGYRYRIDVFFLEKLDWIFVFVEGPIQLTPECGQGRRLRVTDGDQIRDFEDVGREMRAKIAAAKQGKL